METYQTGITVSTFISNTVISAQMGQLDDVARKRIDRWRRSAGITQAALAERIGRNPVWISRYLDDAYDADLDTLQRMAEALGRSLNELLGADAPPTAEGELIERYRALDETARTLALQLLRSWTPGVDWPSSERPTGSSGAGTRGATGRASKRGSRRD